MSESAAFPTDEDEMVSIPLHTLQWLLVGLCEGKVAASSYAIRDAGEYGILTQAVVDAGGFDPVQRKRDFEGKNV